jgi:hypothetical protein
MISSKSNNKDIYERIKILGNSLLSVDKISDRFLQRANKERIQNAKVLKMLNYLLSFECFQELESYWFWYYDPEDPEEWNEILDHVYQRSLTPNDLMN